MDKRALITGAAGQDGWYLIELLLASGYTVFAQSRRAIDPDTHKGPVHWRRGNLADDAFLLALLREAAPDEIYNLAAVSRPAASWDIPIETALLNALVPQRICEYIRLERPTCRLFQASSSEQYGDTRVQHQDEHTSANPASPYGISKAFAHQTVGAYRQQYGLHMSCGILFNHESPRRPLNFVSQKIAHAAAAAIVGLTDTRELDERGRPILNGGKLYLGDTSVKRDFGYAGDVVAAMHGIVRHDTPGDYAVGTGQAHSIQEFCEAAFAVGGLDWKNYVAFDEALVRKIDSHFTQADPGRLQREIGWQPRVGFAELVEMMVRDRIRVIRLTYCIAES